MPNGVTAEVPGPSRPKATPPRPNGVSLAKMFQSDALQAERCHCGAVWSFCPKATPPRPNGVRLECFGAGHVELDENVSKWHRSGSTVSYWSVLAHLEIIFRKCFKVTPFRLNGVFGDHFSRLPGEVCVCVQDSLHKQRFLQATSGLTKMFQSDTVQALRCQIGVFWRIWRSFFTPPWGGVRPRAGPAAQTKVQCVCVCRIHCTNKGFVCVCRV